MAGDTFNKSLKEYRSSNNGKLYKEFQLTIGARHYKYDIYWGDPNVIFSQNTQQESSPLAVTIIPHKVGLPDPRIFLHERLDLGDSQVFEAVVAHEIGHLWLHDIVGFNNPSTNYSMTDQETELWCDYFAFCFFAKYRDIGNPQEFAAIIARAGHVQMALYSIEQSPENLSRYSLRSKDFIEFVEKVNQAYAANDNFVVQMVDACETTLLALGDIFQNQSKAH